MTKITAELNDDLERLYDAEKMLQQKVDMELPMNYNEP